MEQQSSDHRLVVHGATPNANHAPPRRQQTQSQSQSQIQRQSERRTRERRVARLAAMRTQVERLDRVALVLPLLSDADAVWDDFLDDDTKRTRDALRRLSPVAEELQRLRHEHALLVSRVHDYGPMVRVLQDAVGPSRHHSTTKTGSSRSDWHRNGQRWRALARIHFRPWTVAHCERELAAATRAMNRFMQSTDRSSSGLSFMGWHDSRRVDTTSSGFQFTLHKSFYGFDLDRYIAIVWRMYTELDLNSDIIYDGRAKLSLDVLQEIAPAMWLVRFVESYDDRPTNIHRVYLVARVDTDDGGVVQYMRSVAVPEIQQAIHQAHDAWANDFYWLRWDLLDAASERPRSSTNFRVSLGGSLADVESVASLYHWFFALVRALVRAEALATGRPLLEFS